MKKDTQRKIAVASTFLGCTILSYLFMTVHSPFYNCLTTVLTVMALILILGSIPIMINCEGDD